MAKLTGPAMSFSASGSLGHALIFRTTARGAQAQRAPNRTTAPTPAQVRERADFKDACDTWRTLAADIKQQWHDAAAIRHRASRQFWLAEWRIQRATPDRLPMIPALNV